MVYACRISAQFNKFYVFVFLLRLSRRFLFLPSLFTQKAAQENKMNTRERGEDELKFLLILRLCRVNLFNALCFEEAFSFCCWIIYDLGWCHWEKRKMKKKSLKYVFTVSSQRDLLCCCLISGWIIWMQVDRKAQLYLFFFLGTHQKLRKVSKKKKKCSCTQVKHFWVIHCVQSYNVGIFEFSTFLLLNTR